MGTETDGIDHYFMHIDGEHIASVQTEETANAVLRLVDCKIFAAIRVAEVVVMALG